MKWPVIFMLSVSIQASAAESYLKKVDECKPVASSKKVFLVKQWHLSPGDDTKAHPEKKLPAAQNQKEIYLALEQWVKDKKIDTVLAEGCEGEINSSFKPAFNGWTIQDLSKQSSKPAYDDIATHAVLKLEAKLGKQVRSMCADDLDLVKKSQMALSDLRADVGFWTRLKENEKNPAKQKIYLEGVIESFHLKKDATSDDAIKAVKDDLKKTFTQFQSLSSQRDFKMLETLKSETSAQPIVVVFGGMHIAHQKEILENAKFNCEIYEPLHYQNDEVKLIEDFQKAIQ
jgi:hypothetical protein